MELRYVEVDYHDPAQARALVELLENYALDPMGGGEPLPEQVSANLPAALAKRADALSLLCYADGEPCGLINCFEGFSTFKCQPLMNIHDVVVKREYRGLGISRGLLAKVEDIARARGCCKLTLEVLEGNEVAQAAYRRFGFAGYELDPALGRAIFWEKVLS
ncbi:MAG: GNAT family N-acetyltransferase [Gammaproteobacteria bacterium]|nr:MAG: GNAT family N-acetyltransferase [Gammaproteobacteria bacterium]